MNQILISDELLDKYPNNLLNKKNKNFYLFKTLFFICFIILIIVIGYYLYLQYEKKQNENLSKEIAGNFSITHLYEDSDTYNSSRISTQNIYQTDTSTFRVIGLIEIQSIGVYYPIIDEFSDQLLKIAPCKFLGPNPNEIRKSLHCRS